MGRPGQSPMAGSPVSDRRERDAGERDLLADEREQEADERERLADEREREADERESSSMSLPMRLVGKQPTSKGVRRRPSNAHGPGSWLPGTVWSELQQPCDTQRQAPCGPGQGSAGPLGKASGN